MTRLPRRLLVLLALVAMPSIAAADDDPLVGLWLYRSVSTPGLHGELTVTRKGTSWRATLSGAEVRFEAAGTDVRFALGPDRGAFRGTLTDQAIDGFWVQPPSPAYDERDPGRTGYPFATPVSLRRAGPGVWRGAVRPLDERVTLYLKIDRGTDGALVAAFRNPERNSNGGASLFRVSRDGDRIRIGHKPRPDAPEIGFDATLLRSPDRLRLAWPELGTTIELVRRAPSQAPQFFPGPPGERYVYRRPATTGDGWTTARAREVGLDEAALARLVGKLIAADPASRRPSLIHALLVARRGKLVVEEYFFGFGRDTPHDLRSAGKTFSSVMLGAVMRRGDRIGPDSKVVELLAGLGPIAHLDPRKSQITLAHLMTHSAGLACDDNDDASPGNEDTLWTQRTEPNLWKYTLDLPMRHEPGTRYAYCSANINLVGGALTIATGSWLPQLFERTVARPLQFGRYHWNLDRRGEGYLGGGAYVRPRDLLKLGQVYLDGGVWRGQRIVDAAWVERSTAPVIEISPATTGLAVDAFQDAYITGPDGPSKDGYAWHLVGIRSGDRTHREFEASGNGGQLLLVIPELELVVVLTGGNYNQGGIWNRWRQDVVGAELIPAIRR
jgi:CubicO group peptidase (beta-lactamase class C family)